MNIFKHDYLGIHGMTPMYEKLLHKAEQEQIIIVHQPFSKKIKGLYYDKVIALNKNIDTTAERTCVLAEELGHYYTTAGNILDQKKIINRKQERRAQAWAYKRLVPLVKLIEAFEAGIRSRHELAEYLQVTEKFLDAALKYYKEKHGFHYRIGEYWICFKPLGIIKELENRHQE